MGSGGGSGSQNTVQTSQQIPEFEQQFGQNNLNLAQSLQANPYPQYNAPLVAGMTDQQNQGMSEVPLAASSYQPDLQAAEGVTQGALNPWVNPNSAMNIPGGISTQNPMAAYSGLNSPIQQGVGAGNTFGAAGMQTMPNANIGAYMNPYAQAALQPQLQQMQTQLGQEQNQIGASSTQAGAFGDARQGVESGLANQNANLAMSGVEAQGMNSAYQAAQQGFQNDQSNLLNAYNSGGQLGISQEGANLNAFSGAQAASAQQNQSQLAAWNAANQSGQNEQQLQLAGGAQYGQLGTSQQQLGLNAANALYSSGSQQQALNQQALNTQYGQFENQAQWPYQMLNVGESALAITPYNTQNNVTLPQPSGAAQGLGAFSSAAGTLGSLFGQQKPSAYAGGTAA